MLSNGGKRRFGFTLIELLVVIAIIAILAAILFPVITAAKEQGRMARCQSNLKQLALAATSYADNNSGKLPHTMFVCYPRMYGPYISKTDAKTTKNTILRCPSKQAYAWNWYLVGEISNVESSGNWGMPNCDLKEVENYDYGTGYADGRSFSSVQKPSKTPCAFDGFEHPDYLGWGWAINDAFNSQRMTNRHHNGSNYAFLDGHVRWYKAVNTKMNSKTAYIYFDGFDYDGDGRLGSADTIR